MLPCCGFHPARPQRCQPVVNHPGPAVHNHIHLGERAQGIAQQRIAGMLGPAGAKIAPTAPVTQGRVF